MEVRNLMEEYSSNVFDQIQTNMTQELKPGTFTVQKYTDVNPRNPTGSHIDTVTVATSLLACMSTPLGHVYGATAQRYGWSRIVLSQPLCPKAFPLLEIHQ